ncbi:HAD-IIB family hydrolase [Alkalihalobacillus sp. APA_J-10(15)]|nr:HAD-IIB family hydrolase [Halalkalibacter sp. APA_J-10(15)]
MNLKLTKSFIHTSTTKYIIFFDFDETYFPHDCTDELLRNLNELEDYLQFLVLDQSIKIVWVTGSDLSQIAHKMKRANMSYSPHVIASNLGTELYNVSEKGELLLNEDWEHRLKNVYFSSRAVKELENELSHVYNIKLVEQTQFGQKGYKWNYYYFEESKTKSQYDLKIIRHLAKLNELGMNISKCNPKAGDPENAYDIDFIPLNMGKKEIVEFMIRYYQVSLSNTIAFGDSGNDLEMLKTVQHGYLLENATEEAKRFHDQITDSHYSLGILEVLNKLFPHSK